MMGSRSRRVLAALAVAALSLVAFRSAPAQAQAPTNDACLECHDSRKAKIEVPAKDGARPLGAIDLVKFASSVHAHLPCVGCHQDVTDAKAQHERKPDAKRADCVECHTDLWDKAKGEAGSPRKDRLEKVARNIEAYKGSFHARPSKEAPTRVNAVCSECHGSHEFNIPPASSPYHDSWRLAVPKSCGAACHEDQLEAYEGSVHGKAVLDKKDAKAAVCVDCHSSHRILSSTADPFKLAIIDNCGDCHKDARASYLTTYHGQVRNLGYTYTAKCYNCHGSHKILKVADPKSTVHPNNRLATCQTCHSDKKPGMRDATAGFVSFGPHANANDFSKYPEVWLASRFMLALLFFVFLFFWAHSGLWYWREWQDRKTGKKMITRIDVARLGIDQKKHVTRFGVGWRIAHLAFALVTMTLVLTGTSALFAETAWAPVVAKLVGGPKALGIIHRVAAALFVGLFMGHLFYVVYHLARAKNFRWFGPDSLIPNWKDLADCYGMFKWFLNLGPKPKFERWAYFEKFDYWAVFWGVNIIGWSGLMLALPHVTATYLPGWVFNVATLVHGEEAFLAAVFLFTVHFFNNHFRPDKLPPPDVVMFTGTLSLEEFQRDHTAQFERLVASGELKAYLVDAPSRGFHRGSVVLGLVLLAIGLGLLVLVGIGTYERLL